MNKAATALKAAVGALCVARSQAASGQLMSLEPAPSDVPLEGFSWVAIAATAVVSVVLTVGSLCWLWGGPADPFEDAVGEPLGDRVLGLRIGVIRPFFEVELTCGRHPGDRQDRPGKRGSDELDLVRMSAPSVKEHHRMPI